MITTYTGVVIRHEPVFSAAIGIGIFTALFTTIRSVMRSLVLGSGGPAMYGVGCMSLSTIQSPCHGPVERARRYAWGTATAAANLPLDLLTPVTTGEAVGLEPAMRWARLVSRIAGRCGLPLMPAVSDIRRQQEWSIDHR
jgi:hypothetical protein